MITQIPWLSKELMFYRFKACIDPKLKEMVNPLIKNRVDMDWDDLIKLVEPYDTAYQASKKSNRYHKTNTPFRHSKQAKQLLEETQHNYSQQSQSILPTKEQTFLFK